jgi:hypothetical protein
MNDFPIVQGQMVSWAEIECSLAIYGGPEFKTADYNAVDWDDALEPGKVRGTGPTIRGRTTGEYDANASMAMYFDKGDEFEAALEAINPKVGLVVFDFMLQYSPLAGEGKVHTVKLMGCRIAGRQSSNAPGVDATVVTYPLSVVKVFKNGRCLV